MIYIIRHGQTHLNQLHLLQGRSNAPLNDTGIGQAQKASLALQRQGISFDHVFSSPLDRALHTARIIAPNTAVSIDDRLIEMDYGPYEGIDLHHLPDEILAFFNDFVNTPAPQGMEQLFSVVQRTGAFLEDIRGLKGNTLVSTHAIAMKGALEYTTPGSNGGYWSKYIGNCSVYAVNNENGSLGVPFEVL